jgi:hypothetical protein
MNTLSNLIVSNKNQPDFRATAIVPGDKIKPKASKQDFDEYTLLKALDKRYRNQPQVEPELLDKALAMKSLQDAVEYLKDVLVKFAGHDRDVILTQHELQERALRLEASGMMTALIRCLAVGDVMESQIRLAVRQQISIRKLNRDVEHVEVSLMRAMKDDKHVAMTFKGQNRVWNLVQSTPLLQDQYFAFYKKALRLDYVRPEPLPEQDF